MPAQARRERVVLLARLQRALPERGYLLDFLRKLQKRAPAAFDRVQYIEQPTPAT